MTFTLKIEAANRVGGHIFVLDGLLESGSISGECEATIVELAQVIRVKSVGIGGSPTNDPNRLSLHIEEPSFPFHRIEGGMMLKSG